MKVIYVNSKDKYENVIGSQEFRKALNLDDTHLLPTENSNKKSTHIDPFNTEYNENEDEIMEEDDPLAGLPMSEQEADVYLSDETRMPRVRARSKDLDESGAYYDSAIESGTTKMIFSLFTICACSLIVLI